MPEEGRDLILAGAIISILLNPLLFAALGRMLHRIEQRGGGAEITAAAVTDLPTTSLRDHLVLVGFGRVGGNVGEALEREEVPFLVVEDRHELVDRLRARGIETIRGNAAAPEVIAATNLAAARGLLVAIPDAFEAGQIVEQGRAANPKLEIIARAHSDEEVRYLDRCGADLIIMGELEIARRMAERVLRRRPAAAEPEREPVADS